MTMTAEQFHKRIWEILDPVDSAYFEVVAAPAPDANPATAAAQLEMGAMMHIGAAVASMRYASFARETFFASVTGRITLPTVRQLK